MAERSQRPDSLKGAQAKKVDDRTRERTSDRQSGPRAKVMTVYEASHEDFVSLYKKLAE
ncbi:MAG TPA: hypothetical protein VME40_07800 [Caulobacteraceae bacterium]|nr:hypothetical protein [Caulobacteraceae bacterium]